MAIDTQTEEREAVKAAALEYLAAGLSVLPLGGDKRPAGKWEKWQTERATTEQAAAWNSPAVGIVGGAISGNLWILDFDLEAEELYPAWRALLAAQYPGLAAALEGA
ncbi:MAG: bifunctional DNA primase/polymerase, partial [Anaerolineae bacterium]|nr:bifunctional DNA primase/polymerase [Anaerolineae bacterium]